MASDPIPYKWPGFESTGNTVVTKEGDVAHPDDFGLNPETKPTDEERWRCALADYEKEQTGLAAVAAIRSGADFMPRNQKLLVMAKRVGSVCQHAGAMKAMESGEHVPWYRSVDHARRLEEAALEEARRLGDLACRLCPLVDYCPTPKEITKLIGALKDPGVRRRFNDRIKRPTNNRLCLTNMQPGRLENDKA